MPGLSVFFKEQRSSWERYSAESGFPIIYNYLYYRPEEYRFVCAFPSLEYPGMVKVVLCSEQVAACLCVECIHSTENIITLITTLSIILLKSLSSIILYLQWVKRSSQLTQNGPNNHVIFIKSLARYSWGASSLLLSP